MYSLDVTKIIDFKANSLDFTCSNPSVSLPGMPEPDLRVRLPDTHFEFLENKYGEEYIIGLHRNQSDIYRINMYTSNLLGSTLQVYIKEHDLKCNDLHIDEDRGYFLCFKTEKEERTYFLINYQYMSDEVLQAFQFKGLPIENPKLKLKHVNSKEKDDMINFYIFNKQIGKEEFQKTHFLYLLSVQIEKKQQVEAPIEVQARKIDLAFSDQKFKIHNIIMNNDGVSQLFVLGFENASTKKVKQCQVATEIINLEFCQDFTDKEVRHFFYKRGNYVIVTKDQLIIMCREQTQHCDEGQMRTNWKLDSILLEDNVLLLAVDTQQQTSEMIFFYDFQRENFNWFQPKFDKFSNLQLFKKGINPKKKSYFLFTALEKGYLEIDVTFNPYLRVNSQFIEKKEPVNLYLNKKLVVSLDLIPWDGYQIVNEAEFFPNMIQSNMSQVYQVRLPWITGNEYIEQEQGQLVDHFMNVSFEITNQEIELRNIYSSNNKVILATKD